MCLYKVYNDKGHLLCFRNAYRGSDAVKFAIMEGMAASYAILSGDEPCLIK